jgi:hypothetical protein
VAYTIEAFCRIIVSGLLVNPEIPFSSLRVPLSNLRREGTITSKLSSIKPRFAHRTGSVRTPQTPQTGGFSALDEKNPDSKIRSHPRQTTTSSTGNQSNASSRLALHLQSHDLPFHAALSKQMDITSTSRPYLRHSWNRVDAVAIVSFWIMFLLCIFGKEKTATDHLYLFRALSVLRTTRLLTITSGTTTIMTSLKRAAPQLVNVAFFVFFAIVLFSIVGVQSFKGSFRRNCVVGKYYG